MRRYHIVSGIILILPIIDFAVAAPVLAQEKRQASIDMELIPKDTTAMLEKRGDELDDLSKLMLVYDNHFSKPDLVHDDYFAKPEEESAAPPSSSSLPSGPDDEWTGVKKPLPPIPEEPPIESDHELTSVHAPLSSPVFPTWFNPDSGLTDWEAHAPQPNSGPSNPRPSTELDSENMLVAEEPPSRSTSPTELEADHEYEMVHPPTQSDHEMVDVPPSSSASSTNPVGRSMGTDFRLENLQAVSDALKGGDLTVGNLGNF
ncbi:hypothetical protein BGY98DRAFT_1100142 [Russula aff. rugulosa BPL654]|nr:hypothetical protein BGY98DRAFT_1100142 [Russula aff. rugulosa BPL654]